MSDSEKLPTPENQSAHSRDLSAKLDRVDELVSLLVDEQISPEQFTELEELLLEHRASRARYIEGIQLHCDLMDHYAQPAGGKSSSGAATVLSFMGDESGVHVSLPPTKPNA